MDPVCEFCLREQSQIAKSNSTNREQGRSEPSRSEKLMTQISFSLVPAISDLTLEQSACDTDQEGKKKGNEKQKQNRQLTSNKQNWKAQHVKKLLLHLCGQNATGSEVQSKHQLLSDTTALLKVGCRSAGLK